MIEVIKETHSPLKVIKYDDACLLNGVIEYQKHHTQKLKDKFATDIMEFSAKYELELQDKIIAYHTHVENKVMDVVTNILAQLNIHSYNNAQISLLISSELSNAIIDKHIKLEYNLADIDELLKIIQYSGYGVTSAFNQNLAEGMCKIEDSISIIYINYQDSFNQIKQIISNHQSTIKNRVPNE